MSDNPYAPPGAQLETARARAAGGEFDLGECVSDGWHYTWSSFPTWIGLGMLGMLLSAACAVFVLPLFLVVPVLVWGAVRFYLNVFDGRERVGDLFDGFSDYGHALGAILLWYLYTFLIQLVGQSVQIAGQVVGDSSLLLVGYGVNLVWTACVLSRLYFATFFIVDQGMSAGEALRASWEATRHQKLRTVGLVVVSSLIAMLGFFALIVGGLVTMNMFFVMWASAYRQMTGRGAHAPATAGTAIPAYS